MGQRGSEYMLTATVWGGAGEHGRSCYYVEGACKSVLLDCGVKKTKHDQYPILDKKLISKLSSVFLSHAHEDHSVALPLLYKYGYQGVIWTTKATKHQLPAYFEMWRDYVQRSGGELPYEVHDINNLQFRYIEEAAPAGVWFEAAPGIRVCWGASGHLPGSVWLLLEIDRMHLFYSGDYTFESSLLRADLPILKKLDIAIIDAAYGDRTEVQEEEIALLISKIRDVIRRGGHVLLPVPLFGRGQELLTLIYEKLYGVNIVCEAELLQGFYDLDEFADWLWPEALQRTKRALQDVVIVQNQNERDAVLSGGPAIIFAPDGLLESAVSKAYYNCLSCDIRNAVIFTGHLYDGCYGAQVYQSYCENDQLHNKNKLEGNIVQQCEIARYQFKIHQGLPDVSRMLRLLQPKQTVLVHANKEQTDKLVVALLEQGFEGVHSLVCGESVEV